MSDLTKLTVTIPTSSYQAIQEIAKKESVSVTHVLRRALKTEQFIKEEESKGRSILVADGRSLQKIVRM
jgi:hypothetical protein